jgi:cellulose synthase/poly-beta-1,6-N-acetylglucosamine synthase-like glycosyltransferase
MQQILLIATNTNARWGAIESIRDYVRVKLARFRKRAMNNFSNPRVSIFIPNHNHARFLTQQIDTVLQQTFQDFEVILLDDCSTDDSRAILPSHPCGLNIGSIRLCYQGDSFGGDALR